MKFLGEEDDFLNFVAENDGRNFKQGSRMYEIGRVVTPDALNKVIKEFNQEIKELSRRIDLLEKRNHDIEAEKAGWQKDEWGTYRFPPPNDWK